MRGHQQPYALSRSDDVVSIEDLVEATGVMHFDADRTEWAFAVIGSQGYPRIRLGTCVIRFHDSGHLVIALE